MDASALAGLAALFLFATTWTFDADKPDQPPAGFEFSTTAKTPPGKWVTVKDGDNPVLAQVDADATEGRFAMAVVRDSSFKDVRLSVKGKPISGEEDRAVGLVWRYQDADNYYLARSNALESNVRLYRVVKGNRIKFAGKENVALKTGEWHTLKVEQQGARIRVYLNGEMLFESADKTFAEAGKVGVWIKADSVTWFDDLAAEEIR